MPTSRRALALVLLAFALLSCLYNVATPPFENSDEFFHFPLIVYLADNGLALPVQSADNLQDWRQQGNQPPLYHLLSALLISPFDTSDYAQVRRLNPHAQIGVVGERDLNAVLHPLERAAEWRSQTVLALRLTRFFSMILAATVVISAYALTRTAFPALPAWVGVLAASLVAFNPMFLFVSASVNNDNLSNALICGMLALLFWLYRREGRPRPRHLLLIGLLLGASLLSKLSTGPFMFLVGLLWLAIAHKHKAWRFMLGWGLATLGLALALSAWWYILNVQRYGDPTGLDMFLEIVGRRPIPLTPEQLWSERESFIWSFWGLFGGVNVPLPRPLYLGFNLLAGVSLLGLLIQLARPLRTDGGLLVALLPLWAGMAFISLIQWTALTWASQGRLWFIALTALASLSALGFYRWGVVFRAPWLAALPALYALTVALYAPFGVLIPTYAPPAPLPMADLAPARALWREPDADGEISLRALSYPQVWRAGDSTPLTATFCIERPLRRDWSLFVHFSDALDVILAQSDATPANGKLPTSEAKAGFCWQDTLYVEVAAGASAQDLTGRVWLGFYDARGSGDRLLIGDETRWLAGEARLAVGEALARFALGGVVRINAYQLSANTARAGETLSLDLNLSITGALDGDYTFFAQILNPHTSYRAAAVDLPPQPPTSDWQADDSYTFSYALTLAEDAPAGVYTLIIGFYQQPQAGVFQRLRLSYAGVDTGFDYLTLARVRVD